MKTKLNSDWNMVNDLWFNEDWDSLHGEDYICVGYLGLLSIFKSSVVFNSNCFCHGKAVTIVN